MNVWLLQIGEILPLQTGTRRLRTAMLADKLTERGHNVLWWASAFDHFGKKWIFSKDMEFQVNERLRIKALKGMGYRKNISLSRFIDHRMIAWKFRRFADGIEKPDVIVASMPSYDLAFEAARYAKKYGIPVIVDIRDQWPDIFIENVPQRFRGMARVILKREFLMVKSLLGMVDGLLSMTDPLLKWGLSYAGREKTWKDNVFYLGYLKGEVSHDQHAGEIYELGKALSGKFVVTFVGTFGTYHNPSLLIDCAKKFEGQDIRFVLAGDGELLQELKEKASSLSNVLFPGWLDQDQITVLLKHSHIGVCPSGQIENKVFFPNKAFSYLAEGLPILSSFRGEIEEIIDKYKVGYSYDNLESLVKGIKALYNNSDLYGEMSANALRLFGEKFDADKIYVEYAQHVERIAKDNYKKAI
jgi:glycosyltransferase involved in cell wall biosynthesis